MAVPTTPLTQAITEVMADRTSTGQPCWKLRPYSRMISGAPSATGTARAVAAAAVRIRFHRRAFPYRDASRSPCRFDKSGSANCARIPGMNPMAVRHWLAALNTPISAYPPGRFTSMVFAAHVTGPLMAPQRKAGVEKVQRTRRSLQALENRGRIPRDAQCCRSEEHTSEL